MFAALIFTAANARLADETKFLSEVGMSLGTTVLKDGCMATDQCYAGSDPATDCCVGHVIDDVTCTEALTCSACNKAASWLVGKVVSEGCLAIIPEGVATCELIGFGPEDPFADICALVIAGSCPAVASLVSNNVTDPGEICEKLDLCAGDDGGTDRILGTKCGCVETGYCTYNESGCCSGSATTSWSNHCFYADLSICN